MEGHDVLRRNQESTHTGMPRKLAILIATVVVGVIAMVQQAPPASAGELECRTVQDDNGMPKTVCQETSGGGEDGGGGNGGDGGDGNTRTPHDFWQTPACPTNTPPPETSGGAMCNGATMTCETLGEEGIYTRYYVQWEANGPWELQGTWCSGTIEEEFEPDVTPEQVAREAAQHLLPDSNVLSDPENGRVLTNFPVIFHAENSTYEDTVTLLGAQVHIEAEATEFQWNWGDGSSGTTTHPGVEYNGNDTNPDYIKHRYTSKGSYTADLTVIWEGTVTIDGGEPQPLRAMTVERGQTSPINVFDKRNRLSDGG